MSPRETGRVFALLVCASAICLWSAPSGARASEADSERARRPAKYTAHLDLMAKGGHKRDLARGDLFLPFLQNDRQLVFFDFRGMGDLDENYEFNAGLGVRTLFDKWIFGRHLFYDWKRSETGNTFHQFTAGLEFLWEHFDLRTNVYIPKSDEETIAAATSTGSVQQVGNLFYLDSTTATVERALRGLDAEAGVRVPIPGIDLRAYAGGFYFFASGYKDILGPRFRVDLSVDLPFDARLGVGVEGQWDEVRKKQGFITAQLRVPLSLSSWRRTRPELSRLERRMMDPIVRDVDIISVVRAGHPIRERALLELYGGRYSQFSVIDATAVGSADGDLNAAISGLGQGAAIVMDGSQGDFDIRETIALQANQSLLGARAGATMVGEVTGVQVAYDIGTQPTVVNTLAASAIEMGEGTTVAGLSVEHATDSNYGAIYAQDKQNVSILYNTIVASGSDSWAIELDYQGCAACAGTASVRSNTLLASGRNAIYADLESSAQSVAITGNTIAATTSDTVILADAHAGSGSIDISANAILGMGSNTSSDWAISAEGDAAVAIDDNAINMENGSGIRASKYLAGDVSVSGNTVTLQNLDSNSGIVGIDAWADTGAVTTVSTNWVTSNGAGIEIDSSGGDVNVWSNTVSSSGETGIDIGMDSSHSGDLSVQYNLVDTVGDDAHGINVSSSGTDDMDIGWNAITTSGDSSYGLYVSRGIDPLYLTIHDHTITTTGQSGHGIRLYIPWGYLTSSIVGTTNTINVSGTSAVDLFVTHP